jgi:hypothetical protein
MEYELSAPLPWQDQKKVTPMQAETEGEDFMALFAQVQGG